MGAILLQMETAGRVAGVQFKVLEPGESLALTGIKSVRLVGIYCFRPCAQVTGMLLEQRCAQEGVMAPRDLNHETGTCHMTTITQAGQNPLPITVNIPIDITNGMRSLVLLSAERTVEANISSMESYTGDSPARDYN